MTELTGIRILPYDGQAAKAVAYGKAYGFDRRYDCLFYAEDGEALGQYQTDGKTALARKNFGAYTSVYAALGNLPSAVLRSIAKDAGVFLYTESEHPVYVNSLCVGVCAHTDGEVVLHIPNADTVTELFSRTKLPVTNGLLTLHMRVGKVKLFKKEL